MTVLSAIGIVDRVLEFSSYEIELQNWVTQITTQITVTN